LVLSLAVCPEVPAVVVGSGEGAEVVAGLVGEVMDAGAVVLG